MRPELCRLCEKPAADGGYRAAELDKEKLAEWCLNYLGTTLAEEVKDNDLFCYFCVWDARFQYENEKNHGLICGQSNLNLCWWLQKDVGRNIRILFENYEAGMVQQCWVPLKNMDNKQKTRNASNTNAEEKVEPNSSYKKCCYCSKLNIPKTEWTKHIKNEHANVAIKCNYRKDCVSYFKNVEERDAHVKEFHLKPKVEILYDCIYCPLKRFKHRSFLRHVKSNHQNVAIRCVNSKCTMFFKTQADLDLHFSSKHKSIEQRKKFKCPSCDYRALHKTHIAHHMYKKHQITEKINKCPDCPKQFSSHVLMNRHMSQIHKFRTCPACNLKIPMSVFFHHFTKKSCGKCKKEFDCSMSRKDHENLCKLKCDICLQVFNKRFQLRYHKKRVHLLQ
ncbi:zinc finger protein 234-like [Neocloeon triangulifer]|uniref:zinc finger protein 234-like n=1 Tax=Neocloeon triangulifer TaxID=2078957 RepID=UPI00286F119A|nr:zinc finger protein 234-like [Neocloeon triangulifer]